MSEGDNHTHFNVKKGMGLVSNIFNDEATKKLKGNKYQCIIICTGQLLLIILVQQENTLILRSST